MHGEITAATCLRAGEFREKNGKEAARGTTGAQRVEREYLGFRACRRRPRTGARKRGGTLPAGGSLAAGRRGPEAPRAKGPLHTDGAFCAEAAEGRAETGCPRPPAGVAAGGRCALRYSR